MRTNHWNILICFQWRINERSVSSKRWEKNPYTPNIQTLSRMPFKRIAFSNERSVT